MNGHGEEGLRRSGLGLDVLVDLLSPGVIKTCKAYEQ